MLAEHERSHAEGADLVLGDFPIHPDSPTTVLSQGVGRWARRRRELLATPGADVPLIELITGQMSIARPAFEQLGGFDVGFTRNGLYGGEDLDFGYRARRAGLRIVFNPNAVSRQYYAVDPADFTRRTREAARSNEELAAKHPELVEELTAGLEFTTRRSRLLFGTLAKLPAPLSRPLRALAAHLVRSGRLDFNTYRLFFGVQTMEYHRGVRQARRRLRKGRGIVLAYHSISDLGGDTLLAAYGVPPARFAAQLDSLARGGARFIGQEELLEALDDDRPLPARTVLITFDDCYADLLTEAAPLLAERGIPAVAFAVTGMIGGTNEWDHEGGGGHLALLDADGLRALAGGNVAIGSHGATHRRLTDLGADEMRLELQGSAAELSALGLPRPRTFSYPYGVCTPETAAAVRDAGYAGGVHGRARPGPPRRQPPRSAADRGACQRHSHCAQGQDRHRRLAGPLARAAAAGVGDEGVSPRSNPRLSRAAQRIGWRLAAPGPGAGPPPPGGPAARRRHGGHRELELVGPPGGADRRRGPAQSRGHARSSSSTTARTTSPRRRLREHPEISTLPPAAQPRPRARPRPRRAQLPTPSSSSPSTSTPFPFTTLARAAAGTARRGGPDLRRPPQPRLRPSLLLGDAHRALRRAGPLLPLPLPAAGGRPRRLRRRRRDDVRPRGAPPPFLRGHEPARSGRRRHGLRRPRLPQLLRDPLPRDRGADPRQAVVGAATPSAPGRRHWSDTPDETALRLSGAGARWRSARSPFPRSGPSARGGPPQPAPGTPPPSGPRRSP